MAYISSSFWLLALSQAENKINSLLAAQIHKMTTIFNQNGPRLSFCEFAQLNKQFFFQLEPTTNKN
jgi:hypothetical protein